MDKHEALHILTLVAQRAVLSPMELPGVKLALATIERELSPSPIPASDSKTEPVKE